MRESMRAEVMDAVDQIEETIEPQPLELRTIYTADLREVYKEFHAAKLLEIADAYLPLKISGVDDKAGYTAVYDALQDVKAVRVKTDKVRKATNESAQEWIRTNNEEAKRLTAILAPVEKHLQSERDAHEAQVEAIKAEKQRIADERNQGRVNALLAVGAEIPLSEVVLMSDETFTSYLALATKSFNDIVAQVAAEAAAEQARLDAEAAEKARIAKEETDRIAADRAAIAAERAIIEAERAENARRAATLKAEQDALAAHRSAAEQAARDEQIRKDAQVKAEAQAKAEAEAKAENERKIAAHIAEQKAAEEVKAKAIEAARPDADKLILFAAEIEIMTLPEMSTDAGRAVTKEIKGLIGKLAGYTRTAAANLTK